MKWEKEYARRYPFFTVQYRISAAIATQWIFRILCVWKEAVSVHMILEAVPRQADIQIGDTIITSGYSFIFPKRNLLSARASNSGPKAGKQLLYDQGQAT
jgi:hypothetical protein